MTNFRAAVEAQPIASVPERTRDFVNQSHHFRPQFIQI